MYLLYVCQFGNLLYFLNHQNIKIIIKNFVTYFFTSVIPCTGRGGGGRGGGRGGRGGGFRGGGGGFRGGRGGGGRGGGRGGGFKRF